MEEDGSIRTQFDDLLASLKGAGKPLSVDELSSASGMHKRHILKWLYILENKGQVRIENRLKGVSASWVEGEKSKPPAPEAVDVSESSSAITELQIARELEEEAHEPQEKPGGQAKLRHRVILESADADLATVGEKIGKINTLITELKEKKRSAQEKQAAPEGMTLITDETPAEEAGKPEITAEPLAEAGQEDEEEALLDRVESELVGKKEEEPEEAPKEIPKALPKKKVPEPKEEAADKAPIQPELEQPTLLQEETPAILIKPLLSQKRRAKFSKIKRPEPMQPTGVSLQFSEKLSRQVKKIMSQTQEVEKLRMEKEKLLSEHYTPMQKRLEVEIETISDRVLRMEKNILGLHQRASELPGKVTAVEKLQISTIKAHAEMRKAYDEADALIEEATRLLSEERERMSVMVEQSREEISEHRAKTEELQGTLVRISQMEEQAESLVITARASLAEQAERLSSAEKNAQELSALKEEIGESISTIRREVSTAKGVLTSLEKQMSQMRQIEIWADSIRQDYEKKMVEVDDYIRNGNQEFETLRESVEANFVRRYLRELRQLTDSYSFEMNQVRGMEAGIDVRMAEEKKKLDALLEEGRKISYLYEMQSREAAGSDRFEQRGEQFRGIADISAQRSQLEQMIAQVVGKRSEYQPPAEKEEEQAKPAAAPRTQKPPAAAAPTLRAQKPAGAKPIRPAPRKLIPNVKPVKRKDKASKPAGKVSRQKRKARR